MSHIVPPEPGRPGQPGEAGVELHGGTGGDGGRGGKGGIGGTGYPGERGARGRAGADSATSNKWLAGFFVLFLVTTVLIATILVRGTQTSNRFQRKIAELCVLRASQIDAMVTKDIRLAQAERSDPTPGSKVRIEAYEKEGAALVVVRDNCAGLLR